MKKKYYGGYGSNLNIALMNMKCLGATIIGSAILKNYQLLFKGEKNEAYLTIEKKENSYVPLGIWLIDDTHEKTLDDYEIYPHFYTKKEFELNVNGKLEMVFVYIMNANYQLNMPTDIYVAKCKQGYIDFNFDDSLLYQALETSRKQMQ